jgi:PAS domain S-box-containing protein
MQSEIVFDKKNNLLRMKGIVQDITERKKTEEQLQYAYSRLSTFFDRKIEGIGIVIGNAQGDILEANDYYLHMLGFTRKDLEAGAVSWSGITPPEWLPADEKALAELQKQGVCTPYEKEYIRKDGSRIPVLIANTIFPGGKGEILAFVLDITERKRMEEALRQNEALLYAFLEQSPVGLGLADSQGKWLVTNSILRRFVDGVIPELDLENSWRWQARGTDRRLLKKAEWPSACALRGESVIPGIDFIYSSKEGRELWTRVSSVPFRNEVGDIEGIITVIQDIDEQKRTEDALVKMEKIRIKEIHHRIKNNLQVISSLLDLQAETFSQLEVCKTPDIVEAFLESQNRVISMALIHEELYKGDKIDTLDFSAYLRKLTEDVFGSYKLGNKDISLKLELDQIFIGMDTAIPLGIIVNELVSNAFKHAFPAGRKGEIRIKLCKNEDFTAKSAISSLAEACKEKNRFRYVLTVSDNGKGIPEELDFQNTGTLGLQLVNLLVEQIDGCIELKRDLGTDFTIIFNNEGV